MTPAASQSRASRSRSVPSGRRDPEVQPALRARARGGPRGVLAQAGDQQVPARLELVAEAAQVGLPARLGHDVEGGRLQQPADVHRLGRPVRPGCAPAPGRGRSPQRCGWPGTRSWSASGGRPRGRNRPRRRNGRGIGGDAEVVRPVVLHEERAVARAPPPGPARAPRPTIARRWGWRSWAGRRTAARRSRQRPGPAPPGPGPPGRWAPGRPARRPARPPGWRPSRSGDSISSGCPRPTSARKMELSPLWLPGSTTTSLGVRRRRSRPGSTCPVRAANQDCSSGRPGGGRTGQGGVAAGRPGRGLPAPGAPAGVPGPGSRSGTRWRRSARCAWCRRPAGSGACGERSAAVCQP